MDRGRAQRAVAVVLLAALAVGCGTDDATVQVADEDTVLDAVAESLAGSWAWAGSLDVELSDAQVDAIVELGAGDGLGAPADAVEDQLRRALDELDRQRMHGALGEDASFRTAWQRDGVDLVDVRLDAGEVLRAETMTPRAAILVAADWPAIRQWWQDQTRIDAGAMGLADLPGVEQARAQARRTIPEPDLLAVVLAILDGGFGGAVGQLDLADLGVTEDQLDEVREGYAEQLVGLADAATFRSLAADAVTIRDVSTTDGGTTLAVVDLHPRRAVAAVADLFDDAQRLAADLADGYFTDDQLPETIEGVAQLTFAADGRLTEVRTDVLGVAGQLAPHMDLDPQAAQLLSRLQGATVHVVFSFGEHDQVDTVVDVEATTMTWDDVAGFFAPDVEDFTRP